MFEDEDVQSYITIEFNFLGIRYLDQSLIPASWSLIVNICGLEVEIDEDKYELEMTAAYRKIECWLEYFFTNVIFVNGSNPKMIEEIETLELDNTLVYTPGEPTNNVILSALHSKFYALSGDILFVGKSSLKSSDSNSTCYFTNPAQESVLGDVYYNGNYPIHDKPWWERYDIDTTDFNLDEISSLERKKIKSEHSTQKILESLISDIRTGLDLENQSLTVQSADVVQITEAEKWKKKVPPTRTDV